MAASFVKLNHGWNADPNAPEPEASLVVVRGLPPVVVMLSAAKHLLRGLWRGFFAPLRMTGGCAPSTFPRPPVESSAISGAAQEEVSPTRYVENMEGRGSCRAISLSVTRGKKRLAGRLALPTSDYGHEFFRARPTRLGRPPSRRLVPFSGARGFPRTFGPCFASKPACGRVARE
jgi:hypothetical protein